LLAGTKGKSRDGGEQDGIFGNTGGAGRLRRWRYEQEGRKEERRKAVKPHGDLRVVKNTPEATGTPLDSYTIDALLTWPCDKA
jgi:hypothetical protein